MEDNKIKEQETQEVKESNDELVLEDDKKDLVENNDDLTLDNTNEENNETEINDLQLDDNTEAEGEKPLEPMESIVEVDTTYDYKALKYCNMYMIRVKRKSRLIYIIMSVICFIIGGLCLAFLQDNTRYLSILVFVLGVWTLINLFTEENKIDKSLQTYFKTHSPFKQHFAFNNEKIRVSAIIDGEEKAGDYPWVYVQEIHAIKEYFFLFLNNGTPIIIDRNIENITKGTKEDLEQVIRNQTALKPFNQYDKPLVKVLKDIKYPDVEEKETKDE